MKAELWHSHAREEPYPQPEIHTLEELRAMSPAARRGVLRAQRLWMTSLQFDWPQQHRLHQMLTECVEDNEVLGHGAKEIFAVDAEYGVGKSTLVRQWAIRLYREAIGEAIDSPQIPVWEPRPGVHAHHVPLVWVNLASAANIKEFNTAILEYLGYPVSGTIRSMNLRVADALDRHRIRLLIIDDAHLLNTRPMQGHDVLDHIKHINTELGERDGTMILVGAQLDGHPILEDPQIGARLRYVPIGPMGIDTARERSQWQHFLYGIEQRILPYLPRAQPGLLAGQHAPRIWRRTQGYVGDVAELVRRAARAAAEDDRWTITVDHLENADLKERAKRHAMAEQRHKEQLDQAMAKNAKKSAAKQAAR